jgi:M6 family metalloprotease-like protein
MRTIVCGVALVGLLALAAGSAFTRRRHGDVRTAPAGVRRGRRRERRRHAADCRGAPHRDAVRRLRGSSGERSPDALFDALVPPSVAWYRAASYDRLRLVVDPLRRWLRLPRSLGEYESAHFAGVVEDVLAAADPHYDFGDVDALYLITSQEAGSLASAVVDHEPRRVDGNEIRAWVWLASGGATAARSKDLIHETGHVLGLPDLYDVRRPGAGHHHWDVMSGAGGAGLLAWHRWKLGWLSVKDVLCLARRRPVVASLAPLARPGGRKAIVYRTRTAAVVVEVRSRTGIDRSLCKPGVLVYRVDFRKGAPASIGKLGCADRHLAGSHRLEPSVWKRLALTPRTRARQRRACGCLRCRDQAAPKTP